MRSGSEDITDGPMSGLWKGTRGDIPEGLGLGYTARGPGHGTVTLSPPRKKNLRSDKPEMLKMELDKRYKVWEREKEERKWKGWKG